MHVNRDNAVPRNPVIRDFVSNASLAAEGYRSFSLIMVKEKFEDFVARFVCCGRELPLAGNGLSEAAYCDGEDGRDKESEG